MKRFILEDKIHNKSIDNNKHILSTHIKHDEIVDLRKQLKSIIARNMIFCSFEMKYGESDDFYRSSFTEMNQYRPLFYALSSHIRNETEIYSSLNILNTFPNNTLLHLVANKLTRGNVQVILKKALDYGIHNIFVLKGDSPNMNNDFVYAVDLVRFIRNQFGNIFCICVAGYPEMHPKSSSKEMDLIYLKEKVDAGADFIITQIFFEANTFIKFTNDCKEIGINIPIIPGIFPILNYTYLEKTIKICNVKVPQIILNTLQSIKNNHDEAYNYGVELSVNIIKDIIASKTTCGFHFFTLNETSLSVEVCNKLGIFG